MKRSCRWLAALTASLTLGTVACSELSGGEKEKDTTTPAMRRDLSADLRAAEQALERIQQSVDSALGPEIAIHLVPLREAFVTYRQQQCERLKAVFKNGTYGPVAELECLIHLTDSRREFIEEHYDFIEKIRASRRTASSTQAVHRATRTP